MAVLTPLNRDVFSPVLFESEPLEVSDEQRYFIKEVLDVACSDSRFSQKAFDAVMLILSGGMFNIPAITALNPVTAVLGSPSFTLTILGEKFDPGAVIVWNGSDEETTVVSDTQVSTTVDMSTAVAAIDIPVKVRNPSGLESNELTFSLTDPVLLTAGAGHTPAKVVGPHAPTPVVKTEFAKTNEPKNETKK